jgi:hypothetical protein
VVLNIVFRIATLILTGLLNTSLRAFKALRDFEWIGYIEMPEEMVRVLSHKRLHGLGFKQVPQSFPPLLNNPIV